MTQPYTIEKHATEKEWLRARLTGVGASESAALSRVSRWCGPLGLYWRKIEGEHSDDDNAGDMAEWGHRHERAIAEWFTEQTNIEVSDPGDYAIFRSVERPHVFATCDRLTTDGEPVEIKCAWHGAAKEWGDRIPVQYQIQLQHQLYVTGAARGYFAVLLNGCKARWYRMDRHERFIEKMLRRIDSFWHDHVVPRVPPQGNGRDLSAIFQMHPTDDGSAMALPAEAVDAGRQFLEAQERIKADTEVLENAKAIVQQSMGDAQLGQLPSGKGFAWKTDSRGRRRFTVVDRVSLNGEE